MPTLQKTAMTSPSPLSEERVRADYGFARVRDLAFDAVSELWRKRKSAGMKQTDIAKMLGRDPAWVNRAMRGPGNWTLRTFGELTEALGGEVEITVHDLTEPHTVSANYDAYLEYQPAFASVPIFAQSHTVLLQKRVVKPISNGSYMAAAE